MQAGRGAQFIVVRPTHKRHERDEGTRALLLEEHVLDTILLKISADWPQLLRREYWNGPRARSLAEYCPELRPRPSGNLQDVSIVKTLHYLMRHVALLRTVYRASLMAFRLFRWHQRLFRRPTKEETPFRTAQRSESTVRRSPARVSRGVPDWRREGAKEYGPHFCWTSLPSDLYIICQLWADNKPLTIPFRTGHKVFKERYAYDAVIAYLLVASD